MSPRKLPRHLVWLESFVAAVEAGSLEGAAEHLGLARSVVSEHLRALEEALSEGEPLLERGPGRRLHLTQRGERLYQGTTMPLQQLDLKRLKDLASTEASVRLGLNPTLSNMLLGGLARDAAGAGVKLVTSFGSPLELVRGVQTGQLDLALGFTPLPPHRGAEAESLLALPFVVLAAPDAALAQRLAPRLADQPADRPAGGGRRPSAAAPAGVTVEDLQGEAFVDWLRNDPYGGANAARFAAHRVTVHEVGRVESFLHLYELLRAYGACAITPDLRALQPFPEDLRVWPLREEEPQRIEVVALWPKGALGAEARRLLEGLRARLGAERR